MHIRILPLIPQRFLPVSFWLSGCSRHIATCPPHISYSVKNPRNSHSGDFSYVRERIRTPDTLVRSQVLYPAELRTHILFFRRLCSPPPSSFVRLPGTSPSPYNAGDRNRTGTVFLQQDFKSCASASSATPARFSLLNGTYRARTYDPLLVRQMLSQLS